MYRQLVRIGSIKFFSGSYLSRLLAVFKNLDVKGKKVLDFGCGMGEFSFIAAMNGAKVTGIDSSERDINFAKKKASELKLGIDFIKVKGKLPAKKSFFDMVFMIDVLQYIEDDIRVLKKVAGVTKKEGIIIISVLNRNFPFLRDPPGYFNIKKALNFRWGNVLRMYDEKHLEDTARKAGLKVIEKKYIGHSLLSLVYFQYFANKINKMIASDLRSEYLDRGLIKGEKFSEKKETPKATRFLLNTLSPFVIGFAIFACKIDDILGFSRKSTNIMITLQK